MLLRLGCVFSALVLATAACTGGSSTTTTVATSTTGAAGFTSDTSIQPQGTPPVEFTRIDDPSFLGGFLNAVAVAGPGLVAVGSDELPEDAAVWVSTNGVTWERVESESFSGVPDDDGLDGAQSMADVIEGPAGIVAVGSYERREDRDVDAGVWLSADGLAWERIDGESLGGPGPQVMYSVTDWGGGYAAVGETAGPVGSGERRPAVWVSEDGRAWELISGLVFRLDATISGVIRRGSGLMAVGTSGHVARPAVWFSEDGQTWDVVLSEDLSDSAWGTIGIGDTERDEDVFMNSIVVSPHGFAAAGGTGEPSRAVFWESRDGQFWEVTARVSDVERSAVPVSVASLVATTRGIAAVGTGRLDSTRFPPLSYAEVWVSVDGGIGWSQVPRASSSTVLEGPDAPWHMGGMTDVIAFGDGLLVVGFVPFQNVSLPGPFYRQAVWIGAWK